MPFGNIGVGGLILILIIALLIFGPSKLPELGRAFGRTLSEFRSATRGLVGGGTDEAPVRDAEASAGNTAAGQRPSATAVGMADARSTAAENAAENAAAADAAGGSDPGAAAAEPASAFRGGTR